MEINALYKAIAAIPFNEQPYELFDVSEILFEVETIRRRIDSRSVEIEQAKNGNGYCVDGISAVTLETWNVDAKRALDICQPIIDIIGKNTTGCVLVRRLPRTDEQETLFIDQEVGDWFAQEPVLYTDDEQEADRAEAIHNTLAYMGQKVSKVPSEPVIFSEGMTVAELKPIVAAWPDTDANGKACEVWVYDSDGTAGRACKITAEKMHRHSSSMDLAFDPNGCL